MHYDYLIVRKGSVLAAFLKGSYPEVFPNEFESLVSGCAQTDVTWRRPVALLANRRCHTWCMASLPDQLHGARLVLRRWSLDAIDDALAAIDDSFEELHTWMSWAETMPTRDSLVAIVYDGNERFDSGERWAYFVREKEGGRLVGSASLGRRGGDRELEIGYWVRSDRTGRGYATEAAKILTSAAFDSALDVGTVKISMDRANNASAAVPRKLGFTLDDEYEREVITPGHSGRGIAWIISREEWQSITS